MERQVYAVHDVDELKHCLIAVWRGFEQCITDDTVDTWRKRLCACMRVFVRKEDILSN